MLKQYRPFRQDILETGEGLGKHEQGCEEKHVFRQQAKTLPTDLTVDPVTLPFMWYRISLLVDKSLKSDDTRCQVHQEDDV